MEPPIQLLPSSKFKLMYVFMYVCMYVCIFTYIYMCVEPPEVDRIWGIWGSYYNIPKTVFYLIKGDYVHPKNGESGGTEDAN